MRTNIIRKIHPSYRLNVWLLILLLGNLVNAAATDQVLLNAARQQQDQLVEQFGLADVPFWQQSCDQQIAALHLSAFESCQIINAGFANAYSLAHGVVILTSGLMRQINNDDQLAHVLAHEHAHLTMNHHQQAQALVNDPPMLFTKSRIKKFYRKIEQQADEAATEWLKQQHRDALQIHHYLRRVELSTTEQSADHEQLQNRIQRTNLPEENIDPRWQQAARLSQ